MTIRSLLLREIKNRGYTNATTIQRKTYPIITKGYDVVALASTGTGKTLSFTIPIIENLKSHNEILGTRAVILSPSRELTIQTFKVVFDVSRRTNLRIINILGGELTSEKTKANSSDPDIIVATPGRLLDHLTNYNGKHFISLNAITTVVLDEMDRLIDASFYDQIMFILRLIPRSRQTLLFSATLPTQLTKFIQNNLREPRLIRLDNRDTIPGNLELLFFNTDQRNKPALLLYIVKFILSDLQQTIIFVSTRHHVEFLHAMFSEDNIESSCVVGLMDQSSRKINLSKFRAGKVPLLIVTDVAARGLDIPLIDNVINYDFPPQPKLFVHRAGRVARTGRYGRSLSFVSRDDMAFLLDLSIYLSKPLKTFKNSDYVSYTHKNQSGYKKYNSSEFIVYGSFPTTIAMIAEERYQKLIDRKNSLNSDIATCARAFQLYRKTRPRPTKDSYCRAKSLPIGGIHPYLIERNPMSIPVDLSENKNIFISKKNQNLSGYYVKSSTRGMTKQSRTQKKVLSKNCHNHASSIIRIESTSSNVNLSEGKKMNKRKTFFEDYTRSFI